MNREMIGFTYPPSEPWSVTHENIAAFARAIGDDNPVYYSDEAAQALGHSGVCAPPTFPITVTMAAMDASFHDPALGMDFTRVVHSDQRGDYTRPVRVGDDLVVVTVVEDIRAVGSNDIATFRTEVSSHGEPVVVAWSKLVVRGDS
jgi:acyl dehydratase